MRIESSSREIVFKHKISGQEISIVVEGGRIVSIDNPRNLRFPYRVGQPFNRGLETWAELNNYLMDGRDFTEKKKFGIREKDIPPGHSLNYI